MTHITTQTNHVPFDEFDLVESHHKLLSNNLTWSDVGILIDEDAGKQKSVLITLLENEKVVSVFRACLDTYESTVDAIKLFLKENLLQYRSLQGGFFTQEQIRSLEMVNSLWDMASQQASELDHDSLLTLFESIFTGEKKKGRGGRFSKPTTDKVNLDAHSRCMFEGCGMNLKIDEITGEQGNYAYLAHNVASSEGGARGVYGLSEKLSDDPTNVLLLCDKHHRLIDKIAAADYPAHRLSRMRTNFCSAVDLLLEGLAYSPVPAISISWPVQRVPVAPPSNVQVSQSLAKLNWRMSSTLSTPDADNDSMFMSMADNEIATLWPKLIDNAATKIESCLGIQQFRAGLFAFGPMPQLIALGAKLGNKQEVIPMLRYRDGNQWVWPSDEPKPRQYSITGLDKLSESDNEIIITLSFTNHPSQFDSFIEKSGLKVVEIKAFQEIMGNSAIGHPQDGVELMNDVQRLLHQLKDENKVEKVHLLPCASNAICVFFGKAFDLHHPKILVYDFSGATMVPKIEIYNFDNKTTIALPE